MKHLLLTTIAAVLLVGWGHSDVWELADVWEAVRTGNSKALEKHLSAADTLSRKVDYGHLLLEVDIDHISEGNDTSPVFKAAKDDSIVAPTNSFLPPYTTTLPLLYL